MNIVYPPLINAQGNYQTSDTDLEGNVTLYVLVKGRNATITLPAKEAVKLFRDLRTLDVEALARIHAA
jgi:hypothetical protein